jgi:hypothetical protein
MVSVARDAELDREVALKELDTNSAGNEVRRRRFVREAAITGGLEHPGIVPVYGVGRYADGRPYYAMRLIRGETLQEAIDKLHLGKEGYSLRALLTRFLAVCNTLAYAHSRGVIHRDLKPANVMLGPYGETLVVDWGLAKVIGRPSEFEPGESGVEETLQLEGDHGATQAGSALGTPAYMSPEQAAGRLEEQGIATDVYGLGATLYAVLTGRAPVTKSQAAEILEKVKHGDLPWPRQVNPGVPRPLDAVCRKAMALQPAERYPTVMALANDVERWLAGETVAAYPEPWLARTVSWVRRHRTAVTFVTAVVVTAALGLAAGLIPYKREREKSQELERRILSVLQLQETVNRAGGHGDEAIRSHQQSLALLEQMAIGQPTWENRILYVSKLRDLAELYRERKDYAEARQLLQKAVNSGQELIKAAPNVPRYRETYLDNLTRLAETLTDQHEHAAASEAALLAVGAGTDAAEGAYDAARILSKCRLPAGYDASLSAAERNRLYDDRAMELLRQAVAKGFKNDALLKDNNDFAPLRSRPDFRQLLAELESKRK